MESEKPGQYKLTVLYYASKGQGTARSVPWTVNVRLGDNATPQTFSGTLSTVGQEQSVTTWKF